MPHELLQRGRLCFRPERLQQQACRAAGQLARREAGPQRGVQGVAREGRRGHAEGDDAEVLVHTHLAKALGLGPRAGPSG